MHSLSLAPLLLAAASAQALPPCPADQAREIRIGAQRFQVEVAATEAARQRGLSGHAPLVRNAGMWFVLNRPERPGFWMHGMTFPIDLIWVSPMQRVAGSVTLPVCQAQPCPVTYAPEPVAWVLELGAGRFTGRKGDAVEWTCRR